MSRPTSQISRDERGSTLIVTLIIMLVLTVAGLALAAIVTSTTSSLVGSRSTAQARAAADAGVADAVSTARRTGEFCALSLSSTSPAYTVTSACAANQVTFTSVGVGPNGRTTTTKAVYAYAANQAAGPGADMMFFANTTFNSNVIVNPPVSRLISITIPNGSFSCNSTLPADIIASGSFSTSGSCNVAGDVTVGGTVDGCCASDTVQGDLIASGTGSSGFRGTVGGKVHTGGALSFSGGSKVVSGSVTAGGNVVVGGQTINGSLTLPAAASINPSNPSASQVKGGVIRATVPAPVLPTVPTWFDYKYAASDWPGYTIVTLASAGSGAGTCRYFSSSPNAGWTALSTLTTPTVIDARACNSFTSNNGGNPVATLKTNVVMLASSFNLTTLTVKAAAGATPSIWFVTEDTNVNGTPTCANGGSTITINGTVIQAPVKAMAYTPCRIDIAGQNVDTWSGNFYSGQFTPGGTFTFNGDPLTLPRMPGGAGSGSAPGTNSLGTLVSQRDVP
ncbi:hypothetical protein [Microbacterium sp.]|uniref:hypothetical protein n=1 Tax=Microbacterium sp. TaxID=51671 RepID=UPI003F7263DE